MIIAIGTKNPAKVNAVKIAFAQHINGEYIPLNVQSNVAAQPISDDETMQGAINRAKNALQASTQAQLGVGLEGGVIKTEYGYFLCNWGAIIDEQLKPIVAGGARIIIPEAIGQEVFGGKELGDVMDEYVKAHNVRHHQGAIGIFTHDVVDRTAMFTHLSQLLIGQYLFHKNKK